MFWQELIKTLGGVAILSAALAWLLRSIITHFLSKDIETYKVRLAAESAKEVEHLKSQLQMAAKEHDIRFSKLHEKRADAISELYVLLKDSQRDIGYLEIASQFGVAERIPEVMEAALKKSGELYSFFNKHKLYFSKELSNRVDRLISILTHPSISFSLIKSFSPNKLNEECATMIATWKKETSNIEEIFEILEQEFRAILSSEYTTGT